MGCSLSRCGSAGPESLARCRARRRYAKHLVSSRRHLASAHSVYLNSLRSTAAALTLFAAPPPLTPLTPPPLRPVAGTSDSCATPKRTPTPSRLQLPLSPCGGADSFPAAHPPEKWGFWDPLSLSSSESTVAFEEDSDEGSDEEIESATTTTVSPPDAADLSSSATKKGVEEFSGIAKELAEYYVNAAESGSRVSDLLESPGHENLMREVADCRKNLNSWGWSWRFGGFKEEMMADGGVDHPITLEKLYALEKKLYSEVKSHESLKEEHARRVEMLRKLEVTSMDNLKIEKSRMVIESLEIKLQVASQAIAATGSKINRLRDSELLPQLFRLVSSLVCSWRGMHECHQMQLRIVEQLDRADDSLSSISTSNEQQQSAIIGLETAVEHWHSAFCSLVKYQRDYICNLGGWLRLSLFNQHLDPLSKPCQSDVYPLFEEWQLAVDRILDDVAAEGIKTLCSAVHAIVVQQANEQKQRRRSESVSKELEKKAQELRSLESKHRPIPLSDGQGGELVCNSPALGDKRSKLEALTRKAEEEKAKYEQSRSTTQAATRSNLQTGFIQAFKAMTSFSGACMEAFGSAYNFDKDPNRILDKETDDKGDKPAT